MSVRVLLACCLCASLVTVLPRCHQRCCLCCCRPLLITEPSFFRPTQIGDQWPCKESSRLSAPDWVAGELSSVTRPSSYWALSPCSVKTAIVRLPKLYRERQFDKSLFIQIHPIDSVPLRTPTNTL